MATTAIGFANKFYTLWEIWEEHRPLGNGCTYVITHHNYIKNISFDKETAFAKYPNAKFDENLRGMTRSWDSAPKEIWDNVDTFRFGKFKYDKIDNTTDNNYLAWYWDQIDGDHKEFVSKVLKNRGYEIRTWGDNNEYLMSPEDLMIEKINLEELNKILNKCKNNEIFEFVPEYNLDEEGDYRDGDVIFHFNDIKEMYYLDYFYYLPLDKKGKAKRFKNKNVKITKYSYTKNNETIVINVEEFEITK